jgi:hypothetical protein
MSIICRHFIYLAVPCRAAQIITAPNPGNVNDLYILTQTPFRAHLWKKRKKRKGKLELLKKKESDKSYTDNVYQQNQSILELVVLVSLASLGMQTSKLTDEGRQSHASDVVTFPH